jgi:hypothetical protein
MRFGSVAAVTLLNLLLCHPAPAQRQRTALPPRPADDPFVGTWRLNLYKSRLGPGDRTVDDERTYNRYHDSVIVDWVQNLDGRKAHGSYAFKCDGKSAELPNRAVLACRYAQPSMVDGEVHDPHNPGYVYFRRTVSADGKMLTIIWYSDAGRTRVVTTRVYDRAPE